MSNSKKSDTYLRYIAYLVVIVFIILIALAFWNSYLKPIFAPDRPVDDFDLYRSGLEGVWLVTKGTIIS